MADRRTHCLGIALPALLLLASTPARGEGVRVAVLPVVVHSLDTEEHLRDGLADMIASRLGQVPGVGVIRVEDAAQATTNLESARASARGIGAGYVLFGSFSHFGAGASLDLSCAAVAGSEDDEPRRIFVQSGTLGDIIPGLDGLVEKVAAYLRESDGPVTLPPVSAPPADASREDLLDALSEVDELRERLAELERRVFGEDENVPEVELGEPQANESPEATQ